jgi:hypothetical protein|tara:strand:+ start:2116 stop:2319 length:204 start_codon:yes stop_codon:yes gene_type:complete
MFVLNRSKLDRDKIFLEILNGVLANTNIVKDKYALSYDTKRQEIVDMVKNMTNLVMRELSDEDKNEL